MNIFDQKIPGISNQFRDLPLEKRRAVTAKACELVSRSIDDLEPALHELLKSAVHKNMLSHQQVEDALRYAAAADKQYFRLKEQGADKFTWRNWFAKARLATALADGFGSTTSDKAVAAIYELCFVEEDESAVVELVQSELKSQHL